MQWILAGASEPVIREAMGKLYPDTPPPAILERVYTELTLAAGTPRDLLIGWCLEAAREMYRRMVEIGDFPGALRAIKQIAELSNHVFDGPDEEPTEEQGQRGLQAA